VCFVSEPPSGLTKTLPAAPTELRKVTGPAKIHPRRDHPDRRATHADPTPTLRHPRHRDQHHPTPHPRRPLPHHIPDQNSLTDPQLRSSPKFGKSEPPDGNGDPWAFPRAPHPADVLIGADPRVDPRLIRAASSHLFSANGCTAAGYTLPEGGVGRMRQVTEAPAGQQHGSIRGEQTRWPEMPNRARG